MLAAIGDPGSRCTVSQLWAYCGYHVLPTNQSYCDTQDAPVGGDPSQSNQDSSDLHPILVGVAPKRQRGKQSNWNSTAKMRAYLIAESCMKQRRSPYRTVYDLRRAHTTLTHPEWTDGHRHNDALRITAKAILRDLWIEARRIEGLPT